MTEDKIQVVHDRSHERKLPSHFSVREIITTISDTDLAPHKDQILNYTNPTKTEPQNLSETNSRMYSYLLWKVKQTLGQTFAAESVPESMNPWPEVTAIGTITRYMLDINSGKTKPGENTDPFSGSAWNMSAKEMSTYAAEVNSQIESAKSFLDQGNNIMPNLPENETEAAPFIRALCYLKVESLSNNQVEK